MCITCHCNFEHINLPHENFKKLACMYIYTSEGKSNIYRVIKNYETKHIQVKNGGIQEL